MLDTVFNILKVTAIIAVAGVFMVAINTLLSFLSSVVLGGIVTEIFGVISCCLPFDALAVFSAIVNALIAILAFMVAKKIFDLTSWSISAV